MLRIRGSICEIQYSMYLKIASKYNIFLIFSHLILSNIIGNIPKTLFRLNEKLIPSRLKFADLDFNPIE